MRGPAASAPSPWSRRSRSPRNSRGDSGLDLAMTWRWLLWGSPVPSVALRETLGRGEQAILFLNRRGHTRTLLCAACGAAVGCPNCSVALVLHRAGSERLRCHLCGHEEGPRPACAACGGTKLFALGGGTEKVEEELAALLPRARMARLDRDAAGGPGQAAAVLARFARRELDVLVGTQMVAKGHDFPGVTLVGVLDADGPLHLPDFRAAEGCVQLLIQVAGRAGRGMSPGRVLVQAFKPDTVSLDYEAFAAAELRRREALRFPPFVRLAPGRLAGNSEPRVRGAAERAASVARRLAAAGEQKSTRLNSSHSQISYAVFCLKKKKMTNDTAIEIHNVCDADEGYTVYIIPLLLLN